MTPQDEPLSEAAPQAEPIVAVFDSKTMAQRTIGELRAAGFADIWTAVVRGENDEGETLVAQADEAEIPLGHALLERGSPAEEAGRFDGILPPGSAVLSLRALAKLEEAIRIIEVTGGHIEHR